MRIFLPGKVKWYHTLNIWPSLCVDAYTIIPVPTPSSVAFSPIPPPPPSLRSTNFPFSITLQPITCPLLSMVLYLLFLILDDTIWKSARPLYMDFVAPLRMPSQSQMRVCEQPPLLHACKIDCTIQIHTTRTATTVRLAKQNVAFAGRVLLSTIYGLVMNDDASTASIGNPPKLRSRC
ncbi:hypothetical protein BJV74DRAFT_499677 [Russula compacta]|nr:hypothetical protein BJV74DRAFT_499677 [Russula compacta]